ncbi:MAG: endolytic transglycosylase MltG [Chloroflexi bacterium]|nr:endolytic transglycosylase MltG [Chloroflexota bacterium]
MSMRVPSGPSRLTDSSSTSPRPFATLGLILRVFIFVLTIGTVAGSGAIAWAHLREQWEDKPTLERYQALARAGGPRPLTLETIEDYAIELYLRFREADLLRPAAETDAVVRFTVAPGETATQIADRLEQEGLITDADLFRLYIRHEGIDAKLEAGEFELSPGMTIPEIAQALQQARAREVVVTVQEGLRAEEVAELLEQSEVTDGDAFLALVRSGDPVSAGLGNYDFLADRPTGASLEGYLFPDTYRFPMHAQPAEILRIFLDNFDRRVTPELRQEAANRGLSLYTVLTLASIVEREAALPEERPIIASVYLNRLEKGMYLNADPTVQYAMGYQPDTGQWWKSPVTLEEYSSVVSPYNTYLNPGLPPGPICSPGLSAIEAVIRPAETDYLYFVATGDGGHVFARTLEEHKANIKRYQGQ